MSALSDALAALKGALKLTDDVKVLSETVKGFAHEVRDLDRRTTRVEARLDTIMEFAAATRKGLREPTAKTPRLTRKT
jgi:hypothetical protein